MSDVASAFSFRGWTVLYRVAIRDAELTTDWVLVRLRRALAGIGGTVADAPRGGRIHFVAPLARLTMTYVPIPTSFTGFVTVRSLTGAVEVAAATSVATPLLGYLGGIGGVIILDHRFPFSLTLYWCSIGFVMLAAIIHAFQLASALRTVACAGAGMGSDTAV